MHLEDLKKNYKNICFTQLGKSIKTLKDLNKFILADKHKNSLSRRKKKSKKPKRYQWVRKEKGVQERRNSEELRTKVTAFYCLLKNII